MKLPDPAILVITDRTQCRESIEARARALFRGGCRWLSLREKDLDAEARLALLERLAAIGRDFGATVAVHGDLEAARLCNTPLHLPAAGDPAAARRVLGGETLIGQSCHDESELEAAARGGADYATLGPIAPTDSKPGYRPSLPLADLAALAGNAGLRVLALGGVTTDNAPDLVRKGFAGVAVMGEAMRTPDPESWFAGLAAAIRNAHRGEA